jgi:plastocyanin
MRKAGGLGAALVPTVMFLSSCSGATGSPAASPSSVASARVAQLPNRTVQTDAAPVGATTVKMDAYLFTPNTLSVPHGTAVFFLENVDSFLPHQMSVLDGAGNVLASSRFLQSGRQGVFTVDGLAAGSYTFSCLLKDGTTPSHAERGMTGTLTVS